MKVLSCQEIEGLGLIIEIEAEVKYCTCPSCGQITNSIHQNHWRMIQDLPPSTKTVLLKINRRQFKCQNCHQFGDKKIVERLNQTDPRSNPQTTQKNVPQFLEPSLGQKVFSEGLDFVDKNRGYTKRLALDLVQQVLNSNIHSVAQRNDLSDEEVESMLEGQADKILRIDLSKLSRLGIDEIALVKGQGNYLAVLVDLDTHKPIEIVKSRRISEVRLVIEQWGIQVLKQIKEVSIDLWSPYKKLVEELMPNADITADRFHVMKQVNMELDSARKIEKKAAMLLENRSKRDKVLAGLTKSKYSLLKNEDLLNLQQKEKLKSVQTVSPTLSKMHALKEEFRSIFGKDSGGGS